MIIYPKLLPELLILKYLEKYDFIIADIGIIFISIYETKQIPKFSEYLKPYNFSGSPVSLFCDIIDEGIINLLWSGIIYRDFMTETYRLGKGKEKDELCCWHNPTINEDIIQEIITDIHNNIKKRTLHY